ncbi:PCMD domain-containing protein [Parabacteroides timonensis]|uniref:PCMD domain-containing protein n=1 Tax=Parabacteroides timonensis TaxID=1871013 RepID=UPI00094EEEF3|nr:PCMD domain-containing protein [Parabacteroides timonensis]
MKRLRSCLYIIICVCLVFACNEDKYNPVGTLLLNVEEDQTLLTKATHEVVFESLRVDILSGEEDTVKTYKDFLTDLKGQKVVLPEGDYVIAVRSNHSGEASWESPFYTGREEVSIKAGEITQVKVTCQIANTKVSVTYSDDVKEHFINYETKVSNVSGELLYTRDEYRAGYFSPEKLTTRLSLTNNDGNKFTLQQVHADIEPRYHYVFHFKLANPTPPEEDEEAGGDFSIEVDDSNKEVTYNIFIKEEDLFGKGVPSLKLKGFDENNKIIYKIGKPEIPKANLSLYAPAGIKSLKVKADSYQLSTMPVFDLVNLSSSEQALLKNIGFPLLGEESQDAGLFELDFQTLISKLEPNGLKVGIHTFTLELLDQIDQEVSVTFSFEIRPDVKVSVDDPIKWAKFATLKGYSADEVGQVFMFRKTGESDFKAVDNVQVNPSTGDVTALVIGLEANTEYEYYLVSGEEGNLNQSESTLFTTEDTPIVPNLSFDDWCESGGIVYPNANQNNAYWDSGNGGAVKAKKTPTEGVSDVVVKGKAAYLHSEMATVIGIGAFAAGNIYTGSFIQAIMDPTNPGAELDFGRQYTGRPTKLTGYYRYIPQKVDQGGYKELQKGSMDKCSIYIVLCDWTAPFAVNTQKGQFVDLSTNNTSILAYGELSEAEASRTGMTEYEKFEIDIKYRDTNRKPSYILIVASASKYGDYFTGGEGSKLYIDEFELGFDYNEKSFK